MTASAIAQAIPAKGVPREIAIVAREPEEKATSLMMILACVTGSVLILKAIFMPQATAMGGEKGKNLRRGWQRCLREKEKSRDSVNGGSYGDGTSMVCGEGSKPCW
jgi:hypothetical protein